MMEVTGKIQGNPLNRLEVICGVSGVYFKANYTDRMEGFIVEDVETMREIKCLLEYAIERIDKKNMLKKVEQNS